MGRASAAHQRADLRPPRALWHRRLFV